MSEACSHDCSQCGEDCADRVDPNDFLEAPHAESHIRRVIAVISGKGGVGKSLVTSMLAVATRRLGYRTAVLDADITGPSIPKAFGLRDKARGTATAVYPVTTKTGIDIMSINLLLSDDTDPVVWRGPLIAGTVKQFWTDVVWGDVDVMYIDMPPGTGDVALTVFQSIPVDGILVVTSPQELVSMIVEKSVKMAELMHIPVLGLIENMSYFACPECGASHKIFGDSHIDEIAEKHGLDVLAKVPIDPAIARATDAGDIEGLDAHWLDDVAHAIALAP
ncbi:MAG: P-loop NTPase [Saccharofermentanales bacterium]